MSEDNKALNDVLENIRSNFSAFFFLIASVFLSNTTENRAQHLTHELLTNMRDYAMTTFTALNIHV